MSSIKRALFGDVLVFDLEEERREALAMVARGGRNARTLLKSGPLRVTEVVITPGGQIAEHQAGGSITIQPLDGRIRFTADGIVHEIGPGQLLSAGPGIRHSVSSDAGATFLLTIARADSSGVQEPGPPMEVATGRDKGTASHETEAWLRGPLDRIPAYLMPAAHALVQARDDLRKAVDGLSAAELWSRPGGAASIGFHLQHIAGSLDRLFTYARGGPLAPEQIAAMKLEGIAGTPPASAGELLEGLSAAVERALQALPTIPAGTVLDLRAVGRAQLPSSVLGLIFHAAEHAQRHTGQVITTAMILRGLAGQT